ncbi:MAG: class IV adenylate cyclase [Elusimicrobia bacterium]|nr:class IV adenylate cyclase [Elusimicrobiota bacterium]
MPRNIEIKAKASDWKKQLKAAEKIADRSEFLVQEDCFFNCASGRLKLRTQKGKENYLVFYRRADKAGPKTSEYFPAAVNAPADMKTLLTAALGLGKTVKKERTVFFAGQTRIHFDKVEGLGRFIELEVCLKKGQSPAVGRQIASVLMKLLYISKADLLKTAYADML